MDICNILKTSKNIAVVGFSKDTFKDSYRITQLLKQKNYNVVGINPTIEESEINGIKTYKDLEAVPFEIDIVDVFRRPEFMVEVAEQAIKVKPKVFWMQLGIANEKAKEILEANNISVIMNKCIAIELRNCEF